MLKVAFKNLLTFSGGGGTSCVSNNKDTSGSDSSSESTGEEALLLLEIGEASTEKPIKINEINNQPH